jgi:hypothetical protein
MESTKLFDEDYPNYLIPLDPEADFFVWSLKANKKLKPSMTGSKKCYPTYSLYDKCGNQIRLAAHQIMGWHYWGIKPGNKEGLEMDHIDHNPKNNKKSNLDPVSHGENIKRNGKHKGSKHKYVPDIPKDSQKVISYEDSPVAYEYYYHDKTIYKKEAEHNYLVLKPSDDDNRIRIVCLDGPHNIQPTSPGLKLEAKPCPKPEPVPVPEPAEESAANNADE